VVVKNGEMVAVYSVSGASDREIKLDLAATLPLTGEVKEGLKGTM
jgi:hypothetical protein